MPEHVIPRNTWRVCLAETTTGRVVVDLPLAGQGVPSFSRGLSDPGALQTITVQPFPRLDVSTLTLLQQPWRWTVLLSHGGWIAQAGILNGATLDDSQSPPSLTLSCSTLWDFLGKKRNVHYYGHVLTDSFGGDVCFNLTAGSSGHYVDPANQGLSWASIATRIVQIANGGPGWGGNNYAPPADNGVALPIVFPQTTDNSTVAPSAVFAYSDGHAVGSALTDIAAQGVEIEFDPQWTDDTRQYFCWNLRICNVSTTRLGQLGYPFAWDYQMACQSAKVTIDGSNMAFAAIAKGQDNRQSTGGVLTWGYNADVSVPWFNAGWPYLEFFDTTQSSQTSSPALQTYADQYVATNQYPAVFMDLTVRMDGKTLNGAPTGSPPVTQLQVGDTASLSIHTTSSDPNSGHPLLADGNYALRILDISNGQDLFSAMLHCQLIGVAS